jgi:hypothetical protein
MKTRPIKTPPNWKELSFHPLSQLTEFGKGVDVTAMAEHMKDHGYDEEEAIILFEGFILDGRHKVSACKMAGIIPTFREFVGKNAMAYVSKKLFRQHTTVGERAKMAATYATLSRGFQKDKADASNEGLGEMSTSQAAKVFDVSKSSIERARRGGKPAKPRKPKTGSAAFDWREFGRDLGRMVRWPDRLGAATNSSKCDAAEKCRRFLGQFMHEFRQWAEMQFKEKAPKIFPGDR